MAELEQLATAKRKIIAYFGENSKTLEFINTLKSDVDKISNISELEDFYNEYEDIFDDTNVVDTYGAKEVIQKYISICKQSTQSQASNFISTEEYEKLKRINEAQGTVDDDTSEKSALNVNDPEVIKLAEREIHNIRSNLSEKDGFLFDAISNNIVKILSVNLNEKLNNVEIGIKKKIIEELEVKTDQIINSLIQTNDNTVNGFINQSLTSVSEKTISDSIKSEFAKIDFTKYINSEMISEKVKAEINQSMLKVKEDIGSSLSSMNDNVVKGVNNGISQGIKVKTELTNKQSSIIVISGITSVITTLLMLFFTIYGYQNIYKGYVNYNQIINVIQELPPVDQQKILDILKQPYKNNN